MSWKFLSYTLSEKLSSYGDGERIKIHSCKNMTCGDACNTVSLNLPNHIGTHLDFPRHFSINGKSADDYGAQDFVFSKIGFLAVHKYLKDSRNHILSTADLRQFQFETNWEALIFDFGFWKIRNHEDYCFANPGFHPDTAAFLKNKMPGLKIILMDSISLNPWGNRELGREAHRKFLIESDILIVEDVDLSTLPAEPQIKLLIVSPLRFRGADGSPVTVLAQI